MTVLRSAAFAFALLATIPAAAVSAAQGEIMVEGVGQVAATPDLATIRIGVETRETEAAASLAANNDKAAAIIAAAKAGGVEPRDIQTTTLNVFPLYENGTQGQPRGDDPPRLTAFVVSNEVVLRIRDLDGMGALLTRLVEAGATQMGGVAFSVENDAPALEEARKLAVADATAKAAAFAEAAGVGLGPILSIEEGGMAESPRPTFRMAAEAMPVELGESMISASVRIVWAIAE